MTDKTGFSMEINVTPNAGFKPLPDWIAFDLCKAYPVPGGNVLLHNTRNGQRAMVQPEVYASLLHCSQFKTLDQHVAKLIELNPGMQGQQADISGVLSNMLNSGIMVSAKKISDDLKRKDNASTQATTEPPVVAIITWERPEALERLLNSIVANCDTEKFRCLYVIDDSRKAENINQNRVLVEKYLSRIAAPLHYFGQQEQQALLTELVNRLPEHEDAIRFLADQSRWRDHWTCGLSRNLALLLSCGHRLVMMDDDTVCDVYTPRQPKPNITFSDDSREVEFFENEQEWASRHQPISPDPVQRHMQCLGLTLSEALDKLGPNHLKPASFDNASSLMTSELRADSPILVTECGSLGCPGTASNTWLPMIPPDSLRRMLASPEKTRQALYTRKVWAGRQHPHFSPHSNMSQIMGLDNRQMLPPYLPITRGEDRLFGNMQDFIFPTGLTLDYPWAVPHLPIPDRAWEEKDFDFSKALSFTLFFIEKVVEQKSTCLGTLPADRLASLSNWFGELATASNEELVAMYRDERLKYLSRTLNKLNDLMDEAESTPAAWQEYLKNGISQLGNELERTSHEDFPVKYLAGDLEGSEQVEPWKNVWTGFAAALNAWPDIREVAASIAGYETAA